MKEPIIVVCDEVFVFETISNATTFIEPWDTEDCIAYDSEGRLLRVFETNALDEREPSARPKAPSWLPALVRRYVQRYMEGQLAGVRQTKIETVEPEPTHQSELREVLTDWLVSTSVWLYEHKRRGVPVSRDELSQEPLERLISRALEYGTR